MGGGDIFLNEVRVAGRKILFDGSKGFARNGAGGGGGGDLGDKGGGTTYMGKQETGQKGRGSHLP